MTFLEKLGPWFWWALVIVGLLIALSLLVYVIRLFFNGKLRPAEAGRGRLPRLGFVDAFNLDSQRQLVLVRRDNVEHLLLIGGPTDIVVEAAIVRAAAGSDARPGRQASANEDILAPMAQVATPAETPVAAELSMGSPPPLRRPLPDASEARPPRPPIPPRVIPPAPAPMSPRAFGTTQPVEPPRPAPEPVVAATPVDVPEPVVSMEPPVEPVPVSAAPPEPAAKPKFDFSKLAARQPRDAPAPMFPRRPPQVDAPPRPMAGPSTPAFPTDAEAAPEAAKNDASIVPPDDGLMELEAEMAKLLGRPSEGGGS